MIDLAPLPCLGRAQSSQSDSACHRQSFNEPLFLLDLLGSHVGNVEITALDLTGLTRFIEFTRDHRINAAHGSDALDELTEPVQAEMIDTIVNASTSPSLLIVNEPQAATLYPVLPARSPGSFAASSPRVRQRPAEPAEFTYVNDQHFIGRTTPGPGLDYQTFTTRYLPRLCPTPAR